MSREIDLKLTPRQWEALQRATDEKTRYILYGGAKGGGKSFFLCWCAFLWAKAVCDLFKLVPSDTPIPVGFMGRKQGSDFKKTTLETWKKIIPTESYFVRKQDSEIILFDGRCKIFYGGLDNKETINKFNSAELAFFCLDQAEEMTREDVGVLRGAVRLKHRGRQPQYKELYTANPSDCWLKEDFIDSDSPGYAYIPALPSDNRHLPSDYIATLEEAFKYSQPLLKAYRDGDWNALKSSNSLLSGDDILSLRGKTHICQQKKRVVVCDPATSHDECVIYYIKDYKIEETKIIIGEYDTMKIAGEIAVMARKYKVKDVGGDNIGLGKGIFDRLRELGDFTVHEINSAASSMKKNFCNKRADVYWNLMEAVIERRIPFPEDAELRRQLINIKYEVRGSNGEVIIQDKKAIKKALGVSPDRADCFAYGVYLSDKIEPYKSGSKQDRYSVNVEADYPFSPATV